jgi:hypothetical protein
MNKLSLNVINFASRKPRRGDGNSEPVFRRHGAGLTCRWRRDPITGRLACAWVKNGESKDADLVGCRRHLSNVRTAA